MSPTLQPHQYHSRTLRDEFVISWNQLMSPSSRLLAIRVRKNLAPTPESRVKKSVSFPTGCQAFLLDGTGGDGCDLASELNILV